MGDDEIGVLGADFGAADAHAFEAGLIDQGAGAEAARIFEDAAGILGVQRLGVPLVHPDFLGLAHDPLGIVLFQLQRRAEDERGGDVGAAIIENQIVLGALEDDSRRRP